jgi:putative AdoMet-dependent methyltransferase
MPAPAWQYHEPDHPGADFDALAESYDRDMQKYRDTQGEIVEILNFLDLHLEQSVLEIKTGKGEFTLAADRYCNRVYVVALSAGMLRYVEKNVQARDVANVESLPGGFLTYWQGGAPLDYIVSQITLHHLPDFWKQIALLRMASMISKSGKLCLRDVVYSFDPRSHEKYLSEFLAKASNRAGLKIEKAKHNYGFFALYLCSRI